MYILSILCVFCMLVVANKRIYDCCMLVLIGRWLRRKHREARLQAKMSQGGAQQNSRKNQNQKTAAPPRKDAASTQSSK